MTLQQQIRANRWRTIWLLLLFALLVAGLGILLAFVFDPTILTFVAIGGFAYAIVSWFASSSMVAGMTGAQKIEKRDNPYLYRLLENVSIAAGLEQTPELRLVQDDAPNAFAAGRSPKHAFVAVTTGLVDLMEERELEGVLAHEVAHIRNRDVRLMTLVALLVGVIALLADILLRVAFYGGGKRSNPIITIVAFGACCWRRLPASSSSSRSRGGASTSRTHRRPRSRTTPRGWRSRCEGSRSIRPRSATRAARRLTCTSRARCARRAARGASFSGLFSTHPPLEKRIEALEEAGGFHLAPA